MKVVLFCGGPGVRLRDHAEVVPKAMVPVGQRPALWHVMKYYAAYGHKEFILCLGQKADAIKSYFKSYDETVSNDFTLAKGQVQLHQSDIHDWKITFVDTGINTNNGQRLQAVERYLDGDELFLANYGDSLTDLHLPTMVDYFLAQRKSACFLSVRPTQSFHLVDASSDGTVRDIRGLKQTNIWINGGYFLFRRDLFSYMRAGEELVEQPFQRMLLARQLCTFRYSGFWSRVDSYGEKQQLDELDFRGASPWVVESESSQMPRLHEYENALPV